MKLKLTLKYTIAFLALLFVVSELHEIVHTSVGRLICGCWGERDFNGWGLCEGCSEGSNIGLLATFSGPIFSFALMWVGYFLMADNKTLFQKSLGFSLVFVNIPFARILTAVLGGGDEVFALNRLLEDHTVAQIIGLLLIIIICIPPCVRAFKIIQNKGKWIWFLGFFIVPTIILWLWILGVMNTLLASGVLSDYWILGSPILITVWTIGIIILLLVTIKNLKIYEIAKENAEGV